MNLPPLEEETAPNRRVLGNSSVLLSEPTPGVHGVSLGLWIRSGTRHENPAEGGISHLLEHMVFKGSSRRSAFELSRDMEALGGSLDAFTTKEMTAYTIRVLPDQLPEALSILSEMLELPPDTLVLQTHTPNMLWDIETLCSLHERCRLTVQISIETTEKNYIISLDDPDEAATLLMNVVGVKE